MFQTKKVHLRFLRLRNLLADSFLQPNLPNCRLGKVRQEHNHGWNAAQACLHMHRPNSRKISNLHHIIAFDNIQIEILIKI